MIRRAVLRATGGICRLLRDYIAKYKVD